MSVSTLFICDLCGGSTNSNTIYGIWVKPLKINFDSKPAVDHDKHLCQCCIKGIVNEFNKREEN
jgi:hypothetical protein